MLQLVFTRLARLPEGVRRPLVRICVGFLLRWYARLRVRWVAPVPPGPVLFISNHLSNVDGLILDRVLAEKRPVFLAGIKLRGTPLTRLATELVDTIPVVPNSPDRDALKRTVMVLKAGRSVLIFPEGGRSRSGGLIPAKAGVVLVARLAGVPIVPVALQGSERLLPINDEDMGGEQLRRATVDVRIGPAFRLSDLPTGCGDDRQAIADAMMVRIARLLDPPYQGIYASKGQL